MEENIDNIDNLEEKTEETEEILVNLWDIIAISSGKSNNHEKQKPKKKASYEEAKI